MLGGGVVFSGGPPFGTSPGGSEGPCEVYQGGWNGHWPPIGAFFGTLGHNFGPFGWPSTHSRGGGGWNVPVIFSGGVGMAIGPPLAPFLVPWAPFWASWMAIGTFPGGRNSPMKFSGGGSEWPLTHFGHHIGSFLVPFGVFGVPLRHFSYWEVPLWGSCFVNS